MSELHYLEITELSALLDRREISPVEVTQAQLDRIDQIDGSLHSYVQVMADEALAVARLAEKEIVGGRRRGPLHGVPIGIKDLFWTKGVPAAGGMPIHRDFRLDRDATAAQRLREAQLSLASFR